MMSDMDIEMQPIQADRAPVKKQRLIDQIKAIPPPRTQVVKSKPSIAKKKPSLSSRLDQSDDAFKIPAELIGENPDTRSPEFRLAHMTFYEQLIKDKFPTLSKSKYASANGLKDSTFRAWFAKKAGYLKALSEKQLVKDLSTGRRAHKDTVTGTKETTKATSSAHSKEAGSSCDGGCWPTKTLKR